MRTTVELTDEQHRILRRLAIERGERGFSCLVREAVEHYIVSGEVSDRPEETDAFVALRGSLSAEEADVLHRGVEEARRAPSRAE